MFLYNLKQKYNVKWWRFLWKEFMVLSVEFDNPFDLRAFLRCSYLLREDTKDTFYLIFDHVNDIRLSIPYIEIRNASIQSKWQLIIKWLIFGFTDWHCEFYLFFLWIDSLKSKHKSFLSDCIVLNMSNIYFQIVTGCRRNLP